MKKGVAKNRTHPKMVLLSNPNNTMKTTTLDPHIKAAIEPMRQQIEDAIFERMEAHNGRILETLAKNDWDANACYPYPKSYNRSEFGIQKANYDHARAITTEDEARFLAATGRSYRNHNDPNFRKSKPAAELTANNRKKAKELADASVDGWVAKMMSKVESTEPGATIKGAQYSGSTSPWDFSVLTVNLTNGKTQGWKTKMILNVSCLGKLFNQFPSRLLK